MVFARVANLFTGDSTHNLTHNGRQDGATAVDPVELPMADTQRRAIADEVDDEASRPPYLHVRRHHPGA